MLFQCCLLDFNLSVLTLYCPKVATELLLHLPRLLEFFLEHLYILLHTQLLLFQVSNLLVLLSLLQPKLIRLKSVFLNLLFLSVKLFLK